MMKTKGNLGVGNDLNLRSQLLKLFHGDAIGGHAGITATYRRFAAIFYWKGLEKDVCNFVKECTVCQRNKPEDVASPGPLYEKPLD